MEVRRLAQILAAAITTECDLEKHPGYEEACARSAALQAEFDALTARVYARPVQTWADVIARAEIANYWAVRDPVTNALEDLSCECAWERSLAELLEAVLLMGVRGDV
jgi:hypothetical protein